MNCTANHDIWLHKEKMASKGDILEVIHSKGNALVVKNKDVVFPCIKRDVKII